MNSVVVPLLRIPASAFDQLAAGHGDVAAMRVLARGQLSRRALLLRAVLEEARYRPSEESASGLTAAVTLLDRVQRGAPRAARAVFGYPLVGTWAERCLRRLRTEADAEIPLWVDLGHFAAVAAAAAIRAALPVDIAVPTRGGTIMLPTLGRAMLPSAATFGVARVSGDSKAGYRVKGVKGAVDLPREPAGDGPGWFGLRRLPLPRSSAYFDDLDPYRTEHGLLACDRLDSGTFSAWEAMFADALQLLAARMPERLSELRAWPLVVVPLRGESSDTGANATARDSVGAMALSPPPNAPALAESIIHEHSHSKLGALLDLLALHHPDHRRYYSPWRADPRPLSGLLQGVYAFLAVADVWHAYTIAPPAPATTALAWYQFARLRAQTAVGLATITGSGTLTEIGRRFVARLRDENTRLLAVPVPFTLDRLANLVNEDHYLTWRLRHVKVEPADLERLAVRWLRGDPPPDGSPATSVRADQAPSYAEEPRHELVRHLVTGADVQGSTADLDLIAGDLTAAGDAYVAQLRINPNRIEAWTGLALARIRAGHAVRAFHEQPEIIYALYAHLGGTAEVDDIAEWLG